MKLSYCAQERDDGRKLLGILRRELGLSASLVKRLKVPGGIRINGENAYTDYQIRPGDIAEADLALAEPPTEVPAERGALEVLFENEALLAVNKPCGMITHPSRSKYTGTLQNYVLGYLTANSEVPVCHAVNRLDRDTSGVVLFSKSSHFKTLAAEAFRRDDAEKEYLALVYGVPYPRKGMIDVPIVRKEAGQMLRIVSPEGKRAVTEYETVGSLTLHEELISLLRLRLHTGRTHQIRVHCAHLGVPLLGDCLYGSAESEAFSNNLGITAQTLHAKRLCFTDPFSGKRIDVMAPLNRGDMRKIMEMLENIY